MCARTAWRAPWLRSPWSRYSLLVKGPPEGRVEQCRDALVVEPGLTSLVDPSGEPASEFRMIQRARPPECLQHERADTGPSLHEPLAFELAIRLEHGVGVDGDRGDDLLHGRKLVAPLEEAEAEGCLGLLHELEVRCEAGAG